MRSMPEAVRSINWLGSTVLSCAFEQNGAQRQQARLKLCVRVTWAGA
jgi:hypothetical protein